MFLSNFFSSSTFDLVLLFRYMLFRYANCFSFRDLLVMLIPPIILNTYYKVCMSFILFYRCSVNPHLMSDFKSFAPQSFHLDFVLLNLVNNNTIPGIFCRILPVALTIYRCEQYRTLGDKCLVLILLP